MAPGSVLAPPAGLGGTALLAVTVGLILAVGLAFWILREPLSAALDRLAPFSGDGDGSEASAVEPALETSADPALASGTEPTSRQPSRLAEPEKPIWTLLEVSAALETAGVEAGKLIEAGREELPEFEDLASDNEARAERTQRLWNNWQRIWSNRVGLIEKGLPPGEACVVHAAMEPACDALREVLGHLLEVAEVGELDAASQSLDAAAERLDLLLNPPEEAPEEAEDPLDSEGA